MKSALVNPDSVRKHDRLGQILSILTFRRSVSERWIRQKNGVRGSAGTGSSKSRRRRHNLVDGSTESPFPHASLRSSIRPDLFHSFLAVLRPQRVPFFRSRDGFGRPLHCTSRKSCDWLCLPTKTRTTLSVRFALPPGGLLDQSGGAVAPAHRLQENLRGVRASFPAESRDLLLPRLVSGELDACRS